MNTSDEVIKASYTFCRRLSRRSGSNFYLGFLLLPSKKRKAMDALYAFMRHTDDLVDAAASANDSVAAPDRRRERLHHWRASLQKAMAGDYGSFTADNKSTSANLLPALADTIKKYNIPHEFLYTVLDGVEMDLDRIRYETFGELKEYCLRVASAVGLACIHIWGFRGQGDCPDFRVNGNGTVPFAAPAFEYARQAGIALQLTNILRDLKADADADRIYLPLEDIRSCGYSVEELKKGVVNDAFRRLMTKETERAKEFYREGLKLMDFLDRDGQRIYGLMNAIYLNLFSKIRRRPENVFTRQISMSKTVQFLLAISWKFVNSNILEQMNKTMSRKADL
jgi:15-cis-phytoene synthase